MAPASYFWTENGTPLSENEPASGAEIFGYIAGHQYGFPDSQGQVLFVMADGAALKVHQNDLTEAPREIAEHVLS
jgi:hypothetical protein